MAEGAAALERPTLLTALGEGATPLGQWNVGDPIRQRAARPGRQTEDSAERSRNADTIVARRQRGELELGQWNSGSYSAMRESRPGLDIERQGAAHRSQHTLSARLARGEQSLEAPEGRGLVRPDGGATAA